MCIFLPTKWRHGIDQVDSEPKWLRDVYCFMVTHHSAVVIYRVIGDYFNVALSMCCTLYVLWLATSLLCAVVSLCVLSAFHALCVRMLCLCEGVIVRLAVCVVACFYVSRCCSWHVCRSSTCLSDLCCSSQTQTKNDMHPRNQLIQMISCFVVMSCACCGFPCAFCGCPCALCDFLLCYLLCVFFAFCALWAKHVLQEQGSSRCHGDDQYIYIYMYLIIKRRY